MPVLRATLFVGLMLFGIILAPALLGAVVSGDAAPDDAASDDAAPDDAASDDAASGDAASDDAAPDDAVSGDAVAVVKKTLAAAREVVNAGGTRDEKITSLRAVARGILDTRAMGRHAIGDVITEQPPEQQEEYFELFDRVMVRAYLQKLLLFRKPRFGYRKPRREGDVVIVATKIITTNAEYYVDYEMREREGRWVATDVIVENISLSDNYRAQFASLLRGRSFEELLDLMRRKTRQVQEEPT